MIELSSKLTGGLEDSLQKFSQAVQEEVVIAGVAAMARLIEDEAKINVPVKTGQLKASIYRYYAKKQSQGGRKVYYVGWNKRKAPHGHLIEFGTSKNPAYPFIRPAADHLPEAITAGQVRMAEKMQEIAG